jgi:RHS repeat-associated protein
VAAAAAGTPPPVRKERSVPGKAVTVTKKPVNQVEQRALKTSPAVSWPTAGSVVVDLPQAPTPPARSASAKVPAAPVVRAGGLPVWVGRAQAPAAARAVGGAGASSVTVEVLDRSVAVKAGIDGMLVRVVPAAGVPGGRVALEVDYSTFKNAFGGDWGLRLGLVSVPDCALRTPQAPACRTTPVPSTNVSSVKRVTAQVEVPTTTAGARASAAPSGGLFAITAASAGSAGNFAATSLSASSSWNAGGSSGDFNWSYPIKVPTVTGGAVPQISLGYSSAAVDGRTSATNNQPSWIGQGFDFWPGFVERRFKGCADDGGDSGDLCWPSAVGNATMSLNGRSSELVRDDKTGTWRLKNDDGSRVERLAGAGNGDNDGEHWRITTTDGMQYYFGLNRMTGWSSGKPETNSAWTVPVSGNNAGEQCHQSDFNSSFCDQGWRFNLDQVVDLHGNTVTYYYQKEANRYGRNKGAQGASYTRSGWLDRIEYGRRLGEEYTTEAQAKVLVEVKDRCIDGTACAPQDYPDTPLESSCDSGNCPKSVSPTFWTKKRLSSITTQVRKGQQFAPVDSWKLRQSYPKPWDDTQPGLWLAGITHTGHVGGEVALPELTFDGVQLPNRVGSSTHSPPMVWLRMKAIHNEYGGGLTVNYADPDCGPNDVPSALDSNTRRCYPSYWKPDFYPDVVLDWWHKYVVKEVTEFDRAGASTGSTTEYKYLGSPAWHHTDEDGLSSNEHKTWSEWRGYSRVESIKGRGDDGPKSSTESLYFRGMDGDKKADGGTRSVKVVDSDGVEVTDHERLQGISRETITRNGVGGPIISRTVNDPWVSEPTAVADHPWGPTKAQYVDTASVKRWTALDGGRWRRVRIDKTFNEHGIANQINDLGDLDTADDDTCTRIQFGQNTGAWLLNMPVRTETVSVRCDATPSRPDDVVSDVRTYYDGDDTFGAAPVRGDVTRVEEFSGWSNGTPTYFTRSRAKHDVYGRPVETWDALKQKSTTAYEPATGGPVTAIVTTNPLGHTSRTEVDPALGLPLVQIDVNSRRTEMAYDALGRMTAAWLPGRSRADREPASSEFAYRVEAGKPVSVMTRSLRPDGGYIHTYEIFDGLMRLRQKQIPAVGGGRILTDSYYDSRGLATVSNGAYYNAAAPGDTLLKVADTDVPGQTVTQYDGAFRPTAQIFRSGGVEKWRSSVRDGGDRVDATPPKGGTATTTLTDARGRTTELWQYHGPTPTGAKDVTKYRYTKKGQLADIVDAAGNTWHHEYDPRGRMTASVDPDKGRTELTYNDAGQLLTTKNAKGEVLAYAYDPVGRPTAVHDGALTKPKRTEQAYDTLPGGLGMPVSQTRYVDGHAYRTSVDGYDEAGRPTGSTITIPAAEGALAGTYSFTATYNADGSPATADMPAAGQLAAETLKFAYNELGLPTTLAGKTSYVTESLYTKFAEPARLELYAGKLSGTEALWRNFSYQEGSRRLDQTVTTRTEGPAQVSNVRYTYDDAGNLTKIADTPASRPSDVQCFSYDHLRRMTEAWTPGVNDCDTANRSVGRLGGAAPYWHSYTFDKVGNRTTETQHATVGDTVRTYEYPDAGKPQPHTLTAVKQTGPGGAQASEFGYDATGNTTKRNVNGTEQALTWDVEGHLAEVTENGKKSSYIYDTGGSRLLRKDSTGTTLYLPGTEITVNAAGQNPVGTRYYAHGGQTIAMRDNTGVKWLTSDHHGTGDVAINQKDQAITQRRLTPFGQERGSAATWPGEKGFVGGTIDKATGLTHIGAREYDTATGRFISVDPIIDPLDPQQMHGYAYGNNAPATFSDPTGLKPMGRCDVPCPDKPAPGEVTDNDRAVDKPGPPDKDVDKARAISNKSIIDVVLDIGGELLKEVLGINDIRDCFTKGDAMACVSVAMDVIPWGKIAKIPKIAKAIGKAWDAVQVFKKELVWARGILRQADEAAEAAKRAADDVAAIAPGKTPDVTKAADNAAEATAKHGDEAPKRGGGDGGKSERGLNNQGGMISEDGLNAAGGRLYMSSGTITQNDFAGIVNSGLMRGDQVHIFTGTHGFPDGSMRPDGSMFEDDVARFGGIPGVTVHDLPSMTPAAIRQVLEGPGTIIGGFCNSSVCLAPFK